MPTHSLEIDRKLYNDIKSFCEANSIEFDDFIHNSLRKEYMSAKYDMFEKPLGLETKEDKETPTEVKQEEAPSEEKEKVVTVRRLSSR